MAVTKEDMLQLIQVQEEAMRRTMNVQAAAKIDVYYYNGSENGKYENTNHPIPSSYRILNVWNFSTKRIYVKDKQGRTLAEVPQKTTDYFNSYVGAPTGDLYFTIEWSDDYGFEEFADLNIEGTEFWIVASNVPLLGPKSLLADLIALKQYGGINSIANEGIHVKNNSAPWNRFNFEPIKNIYTTNGAFSILMQKNYFLPCLNRPIPDKDKNFWEEIGQPIPNDRVTAYVHNGAFGNFGHGVLYEFHKLMVSTPDQIEKRNLLQAEIEKLNKFIEIFNISTYINFEGITYTRSTSTPSTHPLISGFYNDSTIMIGDFNFSSNANNKGNLYDNNITAVNLDNVANVEKNIDIFKFGSYMKYQDLYSPGPGKTYSNIAGAEKQPYFNGILTRKTIPVQTFMVNYTKDTGYHATYHYYNHYVNYDDSPRHNFTLADIFSPNDFDYYITNGNLLPDAGTYNTSIINYGSCSQKLRDFLHGLECDYYARYIYEQNVLMPETQIWPWTISNSPVRYSQNSNYSNIWILYSLDRFDIYTETGTAGIFGAKTKQYIGSFYNTTNKKYIKFILQDFITTLANSASGSTITIYSDYKDGASMTKSAANFKNLDGSLYSKEKILNLIKPMTLFNIKADPFGAAIDIQTLVYLGEIMKIQGCDFFRGD